MKFLKFKDLKIRKKFIILYLVFFLPVAAVLGWWQIKIQTKTLLTESIDKYRREADAVMYFITADMYRCLNNLPSFAESPVFKEKYSVDEITQRMQKWRDRYGYFSIAYYDMNRVCIADTDNIGIGKKHPMEGFWKDVIAGKVSMGSDFRLGPERKVPTLYFAAPVKRQGNEQVGVIAIRYNFKEFSQIADIIKQKDIHAVLFDRNGKVIYSTCKKCREYILSNKLNEQPSVKNALRGKEGFVFEYNFIHKKNYLSVYVQEKGFKDFKGNNWKLVMFVEKQRVFFPIKAARNKLIILFFVITIMIIFSGYYISGLILRPLKKLSDTVALIRTGDLNKRAEIASKDEIGLLADSFNKMSDELQQLIISKDMMTGELQTANKNLKVENTERKKIEEKLKQTMDKLARSNVELEQFAYFASHDLQEPLRMVTSYLQLIERRYKGKLDKDADEFIAYAVDGASRMQEMINDLLEYSRFTTRDIQFKTISSKVILERVLVSLKKMVEDSNAIITYDQLPDINADDTQLQSLFQNLINNAVKFCGNSTPEVHISAKRKDNEWIFSVQDNGIGIARQHINDIFKVFYRINPRNEYPGTGIGLAVCGKIVKRHGGSMWVESKLEKGTTFYFNIPDTGDNKHEKYV